MQMWLLTKIMYDPAGSDTNREWVEVYNRGTSTVDISGWKFITDDTAHSLSLVSGTTTIAPGEYAVIVKNPGSFTTDYPGFNGNLIDSSWTDLSNNGSDTLSLKDDTGLIFGTVTYGVGYLGTATEGRSLERVVPEGGDQDPSNWKESLVAKGTPGDLNSTTPPVKVYDSSGNFVCGTDTIQKGINACPVGGTVSVSADTYTEAVTVNKRIVFKFLFDKRLFINYNI